ncbi:MarR family transcriptional regulator [Pigmentiphaga sp. NML080357]|uniref:MarR family winged helix-turn-helix transcriptional regulator n=1 Tax=Pigmentiphaga sp. NML080357 TaxID=2008675 RepID=UPI000B423430|nr:MarR family transcriptional regulator [Pigmentiphaga sp. NML080357]OVZ55079.1 MarR family transcriptional regulator [Pigmentiphaga sp. NML080357]
METSEQIPPRLDSASARAALRASAKPYWELVEPGVYLGYYKGARSSTWYGRKFVGNGKYKQTRLGRSHESGKPSPHSLTYEQALKALAAWHRGVLPASQRPGAEGALHSASERRMGELRPSRLDRISESWAVERPDIDFWLAGFFLRIEYAHVLHEQRVGAIAKEAGVNVGELHVLLALRRNGSARAMRPTDLFRQLLITSGAITKRLDRLKGAGLIERVAAEDDRRSELVRLTAAGRRIADAAITRIGATLAKIVAASGVSREELESVDACFRKLIAKM